MFDIKLSEKKVNDLIVCGGGEAWKGWEIGEVASGMTPLGAHPALDIPIKCMKND